MENKAKNNEYFIDIYNKEADPVFRFCLLRTGNREHAIDIAQDTFLRFWKEIEKGQDIANERALLFRIARNLVIDWYRKKKPVSLEGLTEDEGFDSVSFIETEADSVDVEIETEAKYLLESLKKLKKEEREIIELRFVEGLMPKEIAEVLGESANVVSVRLSRAIKVLRDIAGYNIEE